MMESLEWGRGDSRGGSLLDRAISNAVDFLFGRAARAEEALFEEIENVKFACGTGDKTGCVFNNPHLRAALAELGRAIKEGGYGMLVVTGGDSRFDPATGGSYSLSNGELVKGRKKGSPHNSHWGADIRWRALKNIKPSELAGFIKRASNGALKVLIERGHNG